MTRKLQRSERDTRCDPPPAPSKRDAVQPCVLTAKWAGHSTFTVDEVAEILGLSRWSAYVAVKNREIPTVRIGRRLIVPRSRSSGCSIASAPDPVHPRRRRAVTGRQRHEL
jgi:excisionase family DNA binding protein